jgi:NADH-quinone oxidoreductase subunit F
VENIWVYKILERAIAEAKAAGWLGKYIRMVTIRTLRSLEPELICGEETALIESLEGKRGNPRIAHHFCNFWTLGKSTL